VDLEAISKPGIVKRIVRQVYAEEKSLWSFYRGLTPNTIGNAASWGFYFMWYGEIKDMMCAHKGVNVHELSSLEYLAASGTAGIATAICTNPFWVVKTRMLSTAKSSLGSYRGLSGKTSHESSDFRWPETYLAERGDCWILLWLNAFTYRCFTWGCPVHVLRRAEEVADTAEARISGPKTCSPCFLNHLISEQYRVGVCLNAVKNNGTDGDLSLSSH